MKRILLLTMIMAFAVSAVDARENSSPPPGNGATTTEIGPGALLGGTIIYENGNTDINSDSGNEMTNWIQADDFQIATNEIVDAAECDWFSTTAGHPLWDGTIEWKIYFDNGGTPGLVHASGNGSNIQTVVIGNAQGWEWYNTAFDLGQQVLLTAGQRYWLGLHFSTDCSTRDEVYWAYSSQQAFNFSQETFECVETGFLSFFAEDRAFSLISLETVSTDSETWGGIKGLYR